MLMTYACGVILTNLVMLSHCAQKIWLPDSDIRNHKHWKVEQNCEGLIFPEDVESIVWLDFINTNQVVLPKSGQIAIDDGLDLLLEEVPENSLNCIILKPEDFPTRDWYDPVNWVNPGLSTNVAVPHMERVPCRDDVIFPKGVRSGSITFSQNLQQLLLTSFKFDEDYWNTDDWKVYGEGIMEDIFYDHPQILIRNNFNNSTRHCYSIPDYVVCQHVDDEELNCLEPVQPEGFCTKICGAYILIDPKSVGIGKIRDMLKELSYESSVYASEVKKVEGCSTGDVTCKLMENFIQVVFTEEAFSGASTDDARSFHQKIIQGIGEKAIVIVQLSGPYYLKGEVMKNALRITFATLFAVVISLAAIILLYQFNHSVATIRDRIMSSRPLSHVFATFSRDNVGLYYTRQASDSSLHLPESFENPMYGKEATSSQSDVTVTTTDTITLHETREQENKEDENGDAQIETLEE